MKRILWVFSSLILFLPTFAHAQGTSAAEAGTIIDSYINKGLHYIPALGIFYDYVILESTILHW